MFTLEWPMPRPGESYAEYRLCKYSLQHRVYIVLILTHIHGEHSAGNSLHQFVLCARCLFYLYYHSHGSQICIPRNKNIINCFIIHFI